MIYLDEDLQRVSSGRIGWSAWQSLAVLGAVSAAMRVLSVAWDFDAGEKWAHVHGQEGRSATVRMSSPLVFLSGSLSGFDLLVSDDRLVVVEVTDPRTPELVASLAAVSAAFPERPLSPGLDVTGFSVLDLCFASD